MQALNRRVNLSNVLFGISGSISDVIRSKPGAFFGLRLLIRRYTSCLVHGCKNCENFYETNDGSDGEYLDGSYLLKNVETCRNISRWKLPFRKCFYMFLHFLKGNFHRGNFLLDNVSTCFYIF